MTHDTHPMTLYLSVLFAASLFAAPPTLRHSHELLRRAMVDRPP